MESVVEIPNEFKCPISCEIMECPVLAADGFTYERKYISKWLETSKKSPLTREFLQSITLIENKTLKKLIIEFVEKHKLVKRPQLDFNSSFALAEEALKKQGLKKEIDLERKQKLCSFSQDKYKAQPFYECLTCWGENSRLVCCVACREFCHVGHLLIYHAAEEDLVFCDCGASKHKLSCTKISTKETACGQPLFSCKDCPESGLLCFPCANHLKCHVIHSDLQKTSTKGVCGCSASSCKA